MHLSSKYQAFKQNTFLGQIWEKLQGVSLVVFFTSKKIVSDSLQNYTEWSSVSAEYSHRVTPYLGKFKISQFHLYFFIKYWFSEKVVKIGDSNYEKCDLDTLLHLSSKYQAFKQKHIFRPNLGKTTRGKPCCFFHLEKNCLWFASKLHRMKLCVCRIQPPSYTLFRQV